MEFKIKVLSNKILVGEKKIDVYSISKLLLNFGIKVDKIEFLNEENKIDEINCATIFILPDEKIDEFVSRHKIFYETQSIIVDSVAFLGGNNFPIVVLPLECDIIKTLEKSLFEIKSKYSLPNLKIYRLFGKTKGEIKTILSENSLDVDAYGDGLLVDLYLKAESNFISETEVKLNDLFSDYIYSQSLMSMKDVIQKILPLKNEKIAIIDSFTGGEIAREVLNGDTRNIISQTFNALYDQNLVRTDDQIFQDENEALNKLSSKVIDEKKVDISVVIIGKKVNNSYKIIIALNKQKIIDIYNLWVEGSFDEAVELTKNWIMFNLIKKLREKDFENY